MEVVRMLLYGSNMRWNGEEGDGWMGVYRMGIAYLIMLVGS
jgi:hypothetical protein